MNIQATVDHILHHKGRQVWTVASDVTVYDAIRTLAERNVGALLVMDGDRLAGIFSERDYTRKIILQGRASKDTKVGAIVSSPVLTVVPEETVENCMKLMTERRIRHLPVVRDGSVIGVVSIGDLVNWIISVQQVALEQMQSYLSGGYPTSS
jgi:CBS domain-containing protein